MNFLPKHSKVLLNEVDVNIKNTRRFIQKVENFHINSDPNSLLKAIDKLN